MSTRSRKLKLWTVSNYRLRTFWKLSWYTAASLFLLENFLIIFYHRFSRYWCSMNSKINNNKIDSTVVMSALSFALVVGLENFQIVPVHGHSSLKDRSLKRIIICLSFPLLVLVTLSVRQRKLRIVHLLAVLVLQRPTVSPERKKLFCLHHSKQ